MLTFKTFLNGLNCIVVSQQRFLVFQDVFSVTIFRLPRRLQDIIKTYLQYVFQKSLQDVFKITSQDVFKTFSRHLIREKMLHWRRLQDVFKTSPPRRLHQDECLLGWFFPAIWNKWNKKNILLRRSNLVLLKYLRQMKYGKTFYEGEVTRIFSGIWDK